MQNPILPEITRSNKKRKTWCWDDEMEIQRLKERSRARMARAAECSSDNEDSDSISETCHQPQPFLNFHDSQSTKMNYNKLQKTVMSLQNDDYNSFLLPSLLPTRDNVTVSVKGVNDAVLKVATETSAAKYLKQVIDERNTAVRQTLCYRDLVEDLQSKNRMLHCTMNNRIDTVRNFWRNNILEGSTRGGLCVKKALENVTRHL